jgi:hypothetical protein
MNAGESPNFGHTGWRLPNVLELQSLLDYENGRAPTEGPFANVQGNYYWSATTDAGCPAVCAWIVHLGDGSIGSGTKTPESYVWVGTWVVRGASPP